MIRKDHSLRALLTESLLATILVFFIFWVLFLLISISFKPFNFVAKAIKDVNLSDLYFSGLQSPQADTNIILVNIEDLGRKDIAMVLDKVNDAAPAVIGLDVFFSDAVDTAGDPLLYQSINKAKDKLVMAGFYNGEENAFNKEYRSFGGIAYGHANILTNEDRTDVVRKFKPAYQVGDSMIYSFAALIAGKARANAFHNFYKRGRKEEYINYKGNKNTYLLLNHQDIMNESPG
ncbi:MAG TPA: CHASE2 domain-containing protein, partial [Ferruginibacter sp.]|nr:CHASE2 domain-containing protein [Ferruginibacter sp.]